MDELTKSKYCKGLQCPKILWLDKHHPEFGENIANESVLDNGTKVGELARSYFGECELVGFIDLIFLQVSTYVFTMA